MEILDTKHKRKAASLTVLFLLLLFIGMFNFGMKYSDPPIEYGVAINFGENDLGDGDLDSSVSKTSNQESVEDRPKQEEFKEAVEEDVPSTENNIQESQPEDVNSEALSSDNSQVEKQDVLINDKSDQSLNQSSVKSKEVKKINKKASETSNNKVVKKDKKKVAEKQIKPKVSKKTKPEVSDKTKNLLNGLLGGGSAKSKGVSGGQGNQGSPKAENSTSNYYGNKGGSSKGNYQLLGRKALSKPKYSPDCEKEGTVVVQIYVNRQGKVVRAKSCAKGTTNTAKCLCDAAKKAALATKWNATNKAKPNQRGKIIYRFSLSQ